MIEFIVSQYSTRLNEQSNAQALLEEAKKQTLVKMLSSTATSMKEPIEVIETPQNKENLRNFLTSIERLPQESTTQGAKTKAEGIFSPSSADFLVAQSNLSSVDLPDSGDIDGSEEAFEQAIRLEIGFDILMKLSDEMKQW